ncbi:ABC transporter ATP-binding protein [Saccharomonospora sp. NPDC046836]|uniref:ABC transporter ATP-binding protein n=1 Tax=Saccharomonospora sp. NPDC046836 TaxID=3156921 RepID=UPI0033D7B96E
MTSPSSDQQTAAATARREDELVAAAPALAFVSIFRRFWPYTRGFRARLFTAVCLLLIQPVLEAGVLWIFMILVDDVVVPRDFDIFPQIAIAYVVLTLLMGVVGFSEHYLSEWIAERFLWRLRNDVYEHLHELSVDFFNRRRLGDTLARIVTDTEAIEVLVLSGVTSAFSFAVTIAVFTGFLFYLSWPLALAALIGVPVFFQLARWFTRKIKVATREERRRSGAISAVAEESLGNATLIRAYGREQAEMDRFNEQSRAAFYAEMAATRVRALFSPMVDMLELVGALAVIGLGVWQLARGGLTLGGLLVFIGFLSQLYAPIRGLGELGSQVFTALAGAERIIELLDERPTVADPAEPVPIDRARGVVTFDRVTFRYPGASRDALSELSLTVRPGQTTALVGVSGSGKSTVLNLILRFYDPTSGVVSLDGHDLRTVRQRELRTHIGTVLQDAAVLDGTVRDNILWGKPGASDAEVVAAAAAAEADEFIRALPSGYDTRIGPRGRLLSGGQRQRLSIARALLRDAPVLLLDEPTTGLDAGTAQRIMGPLHRLMSGRSTILAAHDLHTVRDADEIVVLEGGRVVERGTHAELMALAGSYAHQFQLHQRVPTDGAPVARS